MCAIRLPLNRRRWFLGALGLVLLAGAVAFVIRSEFDWRAIPRAMNTLPTMIILSLVTVLPLAGFPISMVYLLLGVRFGPVLGLGVVGGITAVHLLGTHWITRSFLRRPLRLFIARRRHRVPEVPSGENGAIALMIMLAPAVPYFVRNYVLALSGIPLGIYFPVALPIHVLRSYVVLFLGDFGSSPSRAGLVFIGLFLTVQLTICAGVAWWLRKRHKRLACLQAN